MQTFFPKYVAAEKAADRIRRHINSKNNENVTVFPMDNALFVQTMETNTRRVAAIFEYLDDERWYSSEEAGVAVEVEE